MYTHGFAVSLEGRTVNPPAQKGGGGGGKEEKRLRAWSGC